MKMENAWFDVGYSTQQGVKDISSRSFLLPMGCCYSGNLGETSLINSAETIIVCCNAKLNSEVV